MFKTMAYTTSSDYNFTEDSASNCTEYKDMYFMNVLMAVGNPSSIESNDGILIPNGRNGRKRIPNEEGIYDYPVFPATPDEGYDYPVFPAIPNELPSLPPLETLEVLQRSRKQQPTNLSEQTNLSQPTNLSQSTNVSQLQRSNQPQIVTERLKRFVRYHATKVNSFFVVTAILMAAVLVGLGVYYSTKNTGAVEANSTSATKKQTSTSNSHSEISTGTTSVTSIDTVATGKQTTSSDSYSKISSTTTFKNSLNYEPCSWNLLPFCRTMSQQSGCYFIPDLSPAHFRCSTSTNFSVGNESGIYLAPSWFSMSANSSVVVNDYAKFFIGCNATVPGCVMSNFTISNSTVEIAKEVLIYGQIQIENSYVMIGWDLYTDPHNVNVKIGAGSSLTISHSRVEIAGGSSAVLDDGSTMVVTESRFGTHCWLGEGPFECLSLKNGATAIIQDNSNVQLSFTGYQSSGNITVDNSITTITGNNNGTVKIVNSSFGYIYCSTGRFSSILISNCNFTSPDLVIHVTKKSSLTIDGGTFDYNVLPTMILENSKAQFYNNSLGSVQVSASNNSELMIKSSRFVTGQLLIDNATINISNSIFFVGSACPELNYSGNLKINPLSQLLMENNACLWLKHENHYTFYNQTIDCNLEGFCLFDHGNGFDNCTIFEVDFNKLPLTWDVNEKCKISCEKCTEHCHGLQNFCIP